MSTKPPSINSATGKPFAPASPAAKVDPHSANTNPYPSPWASPPVSQTRPDKKHPSFPPDLEIWDVRPKL